MDAFRVSGLCIYEVDTYLTLCYIIIMQWTLMAFEGYPNSQSRAATNIPHTRFMPSCSRQTLWCLLVFTLPDGNCQCGQCCRLQNLAMPMCIGVVDNHVSIGCVFGAPDWFSRNSWAANQKRVQQLQQRAAYNPVVKQRRFLNCYNCS